MGPLHARRAERDPLLVVVLIVLDVVQYRKVRNHRQCSLAEEGIQNDQVRRKRNSDSFHLLIFSLVSDSQDSGFPSCPRCASAPTFSRPRQVPRSISSSIGASIPHPHASRPAAPSSSEP